MERIFREYVVAYFMTISEHARVIMSQSEVHPTILSVHHVYRISPQSVE